jgi:hypothetical protein
MAVCKRNYRFVQTTREPAWNKALRRVGEIEALGGFTRV